MRDNFQACIDQDNAVKAYADGKFVPYDPLLPGALRYPILFIGDPPSDTYARFENTDDGIHRAVHAFSWDVATLEGYSTIEMWDANVYRGTPWEFLYNENNDETIWQVGLHNRQGGQVGRLRLDDSGNLDIFYGSPLTAKNATTKEYVDALSDNRYKENLLTFNALQTIEQMALYRFTWSASASRNTGETSANVIAQDLQLILPEFVHQNISYDEDGNQVNDSLYVDRDALLAYALRAIQELSEKVKTLEAPPTRLA